MVAYADLILPDTTYLERHDCISLLDRPISEPDAAGDAIRWPVLEPDRDVRGFQSVLLDLGARLGLPALVNEDGRRNMFDYADYIVNHQRRPGVGPLMGFRGERRPAEGRGARQPRPDAALHRERRVLSGAYPAGGAFYKHANAAYQDFAVRMGLFETPQPVIFQLWSEPLQKFRLSAEGCAPRSRRDHRARYSGRLSPAAGLVRAVWREAAMPLATRYHAHHAAADGHVPFLGVDERLAAADPHPQSALCAGRDL
jgi:anaerobic selenocysteine-containing dehydrogenase